VLRVCCDRTPVLGSQEFNILDLITSEKRGSSARRFSVSWDTHTRTHNLRYQAVAAYSRIYHVKRLFIQGDSFGTRPKKIRISQRLFIRFRINFCNIFTYKYIYNFVNIKYIYKILNWIMNSL
jgi:hypothetical protein